MKEKNNNQLYKVVGDTSLHAIVAFSDISDSKDESSRDKCK